MKMRKILVIFLVLFFALVGGVKNVLAKPRKGVHILFPEEISLAAQVIGNGGYVVVPINQQAWSQVDKWQRFMHRASELKVKPILRLTTQPTVIGNWQKPKLINAVDWANFLSLLDWPKGDRWVVIFNEPNHAQEWGGEINPKEYARILREYSVKLHAKDNHFRVLAAALDMAAPNSKTTWSAKKYWKEVWKTLPNFYVLIDGWNSHAYPNPAFSSAPSLSSENILSYKYELSWFNGFYHRKWDKPVIITETGWSNQRLSSTVICRYLKESWKWWSEDPKLLAVNWFLLEGAPGPFANFSLWRQDHPSSVFNCWKN